MFWSWIGCKYQPGGRDRAGGPNEARNRRPNQFHRDPAMEARRLVSTPASQTARSIVANTPAAMVAQITRKRMRVTPGNFREPNLMSRPAARDQI
jgi:hypothetical protein